MHRTVAGLFLGFLVFGIAIGGAWLLGGRSAAAAPRDRERAIDTREKPRTVESQQPAVSEPARAAPAAIWTQTRGPDDPVRTDRAVPAPLHTRSRYPPGTRIPVRSLPAVEVGILLPDGRKLPFLNGMNHAPAVRRAPELGPVPPVVALIVDGAGFEWWEHADGSVTTSRYEHVFVGSRDYWDPATPHGAVSPRSRQVPLPAKSRR